MNRRTLLILALFVIPALLLMAWGLHGCLSNPPEDSVSPYEEETTAAPVQPEEYQWETTPEFPVVPLPDTGGPVDVG